MKITLRGGTGNATTTVERGRTPSGNAKVTAKNVAAKRAEIDAQIELQVTDEVKAMGRHKAIRPDKQKVGWMAV